MFKGTVAGNAVEVTSIFNVGPLFVQSVMQLLGGVTYILKAAQA